MHRKATLAAATALLLATLSAPTIYAEKKKTVAAKPLATAQQISSDQKILHVLNRLTFGPKPGDVEAVKAMGVEKFIDQQLHPSTIVESPILEAKLAPLDTLRMSTHDMVAKYPPVQAIKAIAEGRMPYPTDPQTAYMIQRQVERYKVKKGGDAAGDKGDLGGKMDMDAPTVSMDKVLAQLTPAQKSTFQTGTPQEKVAMIESLPTGTQFDLLSALPGNKRNQLLNAGSPDLRRKVLMFAGPQTVVNQDLFSAKIYRAVYSNRQLEAELTDFWYNHFNVFLDKGADKYLVTGYERDAIQPHVFGKFKDLLLATAQSPAMLFYLDNNQSVGPNSAENRANQNAKKARRGLNENYGRELMELHTLGVDGGYTQKDVTEVARCFTGWTIKQARGQADFIFNERSHDEGEKHVLGVTIPAGGGINDGLKVLDLLVHHPATARFITRKLAVRFVSDNPPQSLLDRMAATFTATDGDLTAVMKTMFDSPEFFSPASYRAKVKTPFEMVASAIRATGGDVDYATPLVQQLTQLGEPLYRKIEPTGYSNKNSDWVNSAALLARMNFAIALTGSKVPGTKVDLTRFPQTAPMDLARALMMTDLSADSRKVIEAGLADQSGKIPPAALVAGLTLGSPDFQRR